MPRNDASKRTIGDRLLALYDEADAHLAMTAIREVIDKYSLLIDSEHYQLSQKDVILITYGDVVSQRDEAPLATLYDFLNRHLKDVINSVHILPFYPYSSDDGFSVVSYSEVDPRLGSWREIERFAKDYRLMVDGVINHVSQYSHWFKAYLMRDEEFKNYFIEVDPGTDLSRVVRPRATPLLHEFTDTEGKIHNIWTTFSKDQVDLNYANYKVLVAVLEALFYYIYKGATLIRLDAIAYLWKAPGTECVHLPQTHELIQLIRDVLHEVAPEVIIVTETNMPHDENVSYFGSGDDEAQMVYNFALPPLLIHSVLHGDTTTMTRWAKALSLPSDKVCFFNFTASHDGCGLLPVRGILTEDEIDHLVITAVEHGGQVSHQAGHNGEHRPYELNGSFIDLLSHPDDDSQLRMKRLLLTQAVLLAMPGVPGIYFHSLIGAHNYPEGVRLSGNKRSINREKFNLKHLAGILFDENTMEHAIFVSYKRLISIRISESSFDPFGPFSFYDLDPSLFTIRQACHSCNEAIFAVHNFANETVTFSLPDDVTLPLRELLSGIEITDRNDIAVAPYQIMWLKGPATPSRPTKERL